VKSTKSTLRIALLLSISSTLSVAMEEEPSPMLHQLEEHITHENISAFTKLVDTLDQGAYTPFLRHSKVKNESSAIWPWQEHRASNKINYYTTPFLLALEHDQSHNTLEKLIEHEKKKNSELDLNLPMIVKTTAHDQEEEIGTEKKHSLLKYAVKAHHLPAVVTLLDTHHVEHADALKYAYTKFKKYFEKRCAALEGYSGGIEIGITREMRRCLHTLQTIVLLLDAQTQGQELAQVDYLDYLGKIYRLLTPEKNCRSKDDNDAPYAKNGYANEVWDQEVAAYLIQVAPKNVAYNRSELAAVTFVRLRLPACINQSLRVSEEEYTPSFYNYLFSSDSNIVVEKRISHWETPLSIAVKHNPSCQLLEALIDVAKTKADDSSQLSVALSRPITVKRTRTFTADNHHHPHHDERETKSLLDIAVEQNHLGAIYTLLKEGVDYQESAAKAHKTFNKYCTNYLNICQQGGNVSNDQLCGLHALQTILLLFDAHAACKGVSLNFGKEYLLALGKIYQTRAKNSNKAWPWAMFSLFS